jgi:hypothetical protein
MWKVRREANQVAELLGVMCFGGFSIIGISWRTGRKGAGGFAQSFWGRRFDGFDGTRCHVMGSGIAGIWVTDNEVWRLGPICFLTIGTYGFFDTRRPPSAVLSR